MRIVIVARTVMGSMRCLGGVVIQNNRAFLVRPIQEEGAVGWPEETDVQIGEVWEVGLRRSRDVEPPHIEDCVCQFHEYVETLSTQDLLALVRDLKCIRRGGIGRLFEGRLRYTRSAMPRAYISGRGDASRLPAGSVGFWELPAALNLHVEDRDGRQRPLYAYEGPYGAIYLPYVGESQAPAVLPKGTIVRVSLARWWSPDGNPTMEERCYLQLSGWYGLVDDDIGSGLGEDHESRGFTSIEEDDIPF